MTTAVEGPNTYTLAYDGLGDRLRQTVNGVPASYSVDLESGLTQVLSDGANAYLYGHSRLGEEQPGGWAYHLPDALGSVRQLTDASGGVTLAHAFEPYGESVASSGAGDSAYGFTGEWTDGTGLVHLRARYYAPSAGSFLSRDVWEGDPKQPMSYNVWLYVDANPVTVVDPSGMIPEDEDEARQADRHADLLLGQYGVEIQRDWGYMNVLTAYGRGSGGRTECVWNPGMWQSVRELELVHEAVDLTADKMGGAHRFRSAMRGVVRIARWSHSPIPSDTAVNVGPILDTVADIILPDYHFNQSDLYARYNIIHELGHQWDKVEWGQLSYGMAIELETLACEPLRGPRGGRSCRYDIGAGLEAPPGAREDPYAGKNRYEDWAEAFATYVYSAYYEGLRDRELDYLLLGDLRRQYVQNKIQGR